jgi:transposase
VHHPLGIARVFEAGRQPLGDLEPPFDRRQQQYSAVRSQPELFVAGSLRGLLPGDHVLVRVDRILNLNWLRGEVSELYSPDTGRPGIDPEVAVRLMLAGFLLGIVHDRRLVREAQVNLAIRWFIAMASTKLSLITPR